MAQNNQLDKKATFGQCIKKYFPVTPQNVYGGLPIIGAVGSCLTMQLLIPTINDYVRSNDECSAWLHIGFIIFVAAQVLWGFQAKERNFLFLWITCKAAETLVLFGFLMAGILSEIPLLICLLGMLCLGCRIYVKQMNGKILIYSLTKNVVKF